MSELALKHLAAVAAAFEEAHSKGYGSRESSPCSLLQGHASAFSPWVNGSGNTSPREAEDGEARTPMASWAHILWDSVPMTSSSPTSTLQTEPTEAPVPVVKTVEKNETFSVGGKIVHLEAMAGCCAEQQKVCTRCNTGQTPAWRRVEGVLLCNACGLYVRRVGLEAVADGGAKMSSRGRPKKFGTA